MGNLVEILKIFKFSIFSNGINKLSIQIVSDGESVENSPYFPYSPSSQYYWGISMIGFSTFSIFLVSPLGNFVREGVEVVEMFKDF
jgi:hypothetical protein